MFFGEYEYKVDEKGRVPLPPKFRHEFREGVILTRGAEKCISAYPLAEWKRLAESLGAQPMTPSKVRSLKRIIFGAAYSLELDAQGRVALPTHLRQYAEISDAAVVVGADNYIEIWDPRLWNSEKTSAEEQVWQIIESLEAK